MPQSKVELARTKILEELTINGPTHLSDLRTKLKIPYATIRITVASLLNDKLITDDYHIEKGISKRMIFLTN